VEGTRFANATAVDEEGRENPITQGGGKIVWEGGKLSVVSKLDRNSDVTTTVKGAKQRLKDNRFDGGTIRKGREVTAGRGEFRRECGGGTKSSTRNLEQRKFKLRPKQK